MSKDERSDGVYLLHIATAMQDVLDVYVNFIPANIKKIMALPEYQAMAAPMDL